MRMLKNVYFSWELWPEMAYQKNLANVILIKRGIIIS